MSLPNAVPAERSRWKLTAIVAVVALVLSMLGLGQQSIAHADDASTRSISGVVTLPEGSTATLADVAVQATRDGAEGALEPVAVAEDGSYAIADLEPGAYRVEFVVSGDSAVAVAGQVFGATAENPAGELVVVAAESRDDVDVTLEAVAAAQVAAEAPDEDSGAEKGEDSALASAETYDSVELPFPEAKIIDLSDLNTDANNPIQFGVVPDEQTATASEKADQAGELVEPEAVSTRALTTGDRVISGKVTIAAGTLSSVNLYLEAVDFNKDGSYAASPSRWIKTSTSHPAAERDLWNASTGEYSFRNLAPGRYRVNFVYDAANPVLVNQWYPNKPTREGAIAVDVRKTSVSGINGTLQKGVALTGTVSVPSAFDKASAWLVAVNSKNKGTIVRWNTTTGEYTSSALPADSYWMMIASTNLNNGSVQFVKSGTQTKFTPAPGTVLAKNLTGVNPTSRINGKIAVTGGLAKNFQRAMNVYQKLDGVWFPLYNSSISAEVAYLAPKIGPGQYTVEFSAKSGRDVAKGEWWNKKPSRDKANIITLDGAKSVSGVNGTITGGSSGQVSPFKDVKTNHKFYKEIAWMFTSNTSTGTRTSSGRYYKPKDSVSREAMAAFMFRMNAPKNYKAPKKSPFIDVATNHKFYKEIAWMYTSGLSAGNKVAGGRAYLPKDSVSRAAMAAFMYRQYAPVGKGKYSSNFADVSKSYKFYNEISWMKDSGISTGTRVGGKAYYKPSDAVSREAMAAFLYRNSLSLR